MFLQNVINIKYRKAFAASNYSKFKGTYINCKDNSCTKNTIFSLEYVSVYKAAQSSQCQSARQFSKLLLNMFTLKGLSKC